MRSCDWTSALNADPVPWLLEPENPSVRHFTLVDLLGVPADDRRAAAAKKAIMETGVVPRILAKQKKESRPDKSRRW
jgi:hypothetical protein